MAPPVAAGSMPRVYAWLRARLWTSDDRASGTLVSFIVGMAVFLIGVSYLLHFALQPPGTQEANLASADLRATGDHAMQVLLGTAGYPATWGDSAGAVNGLSRLGILEAGSTSRIDAAKFDALAHGSSSTASNSNGYVDYDEAKKALGLLGDATHPGYEFHLRAAPLFSGSLEDYGVIGMEDFRVAYVGQYSSGAFTSTAQSESGSLDALPIAYHGVAAPSGDLYEDDSTFLRTYLVQHLGISVAQTTISNGNGNTKYDFTLVNGTAVSPLVGSTASRSLALASGNVSSMSSLGFTKGREMRAVVGTANFSGLASATMTWKELVDTSNDTGSYGFVELSADGGTTWYQVTSGTLGLNHLSTDTTRNVGGNWTSRAISIDGSTCSACLNANSVQVAFHWVADNNDPAGKGWIVDDVAIPLASFSQGFEKPDYDMLVVGSNVAQNAFTADQVKSAIGDFVNAYGGRIMVLGGEQNTQWLEPLMHVGISGSSSSVATPDATAPLLSVPNELDWANYNTNSKVWDFSGGSSSALFTGVVQTTSGQDILAVSNTNAFGAYGENGSVILTTYLPYTMSGQQESMFLANTLTYGKYRSLYFDLGPTVPTGVPVAVTTRTATIDMTNDDSGVFTEMGLTMYVWQGSTTASASQSTTVVPSPPRANNATPWNGAVKLNWTWPIANGTTAITNYTLWRGTSTGGEAYYRSLSPAWFTFNDTNVTNGVTYYYNLTATNSIGNSSSSIELSATPSTIPTAPTGLSVVAGVGIASLSWSTPLNNGGSALTGYNVYRGDSSGTETYLASVGPTTTTYQDTVSTGVTKYYNVTALNANGESNRSAEVGGGSIHTPNAPTLTATADSVNHKVTLTWTTATSVDLTSGVDHLTAYNVYAGNTAGGETFLAATSGSNVTFSENNVANGTTRYYRVSANGTAGEGALSNEAHATPMGLPGSPASLTVTAKASTAGALSLAWTAPTSWGTGATAQGYVLYRGSSSGNLSQLAVLGTANLTFDDLNVGANNATRYYSLVAYSDSGFGSNSSVASGTTWGPPGAPTALTATPGLGHSMDVSWAAATSGLSITNYTVYRGTSPGAETVPASGGTGLSLHISSLSANTLYYFKITAWNSAGESVMSNEISGTTI